MLALASIRGLNRGFHDAIRSGSFVWFCCLVEDSLNLSSLPKATSLTQSLHRITCAHQRNYMTAKTFPEANCVSSPLESLLMQRLKMFRHHSFLRAVLHARYMSSVFVELKTDNDVVRFALGKPLNKMGSPTKGQKTTKRIKMSKKAKLNELRFYRLKAKKKMNSPNPEVRIKYKLEKAKRKEVWLIEKLRKFEIPKAPDETYDPEILTEEERHYLRRTGEKKKNYVPVGRRGVFGGVVLNMHLHWKKHETVKVICKPCKPGQVHEYAEELTRLSKGIVIDIKPNNTIVFYRGKNYVQPEVMSPPDTLSKNKALEKYKYEQSLEHTSQFIEKLEKELEEYHKHVAQYKKEKEDYRRQPQNYASEC